MTCRIWYDLEPVRCRDGKEKILIHRKKGGEIGPGCEKVAVPLNLIANQQTWRKRYVLETFCLGYGNFRQRLRPPGSQPR